MHVICRAKKHCKLPADQVQSLASEEIYSRYMPGQRNFRVLKRDLGPLLQQVRFPMCLHASVDVCTLPGSLHDARVPCALAQCWRLRHHLQLR